MWDMKRVFEVMDQIQADKRDEYRNMTPEEVHDYCMADFLVATMRVHREEAMLQTIVFEACKH